jgi:hypothetical protein
MEVCIENFTQSGNNLMYRKEWENYQKERCESKTMARMENRVHYDRILNGLTDNRSIDILNQDSLKNITKMDMREYIIKYIDDNKGIKTPQQLVEAIAIAIAVPVDDMAAIKAIYQMVLTQLKASPPVLAEVSIAIDGVSVPIIADDMGVRSGANIFSTDGVPSQSVDEETGEIAVAYWEGDNQVPERRGMSMEGFRLRAFANSGDRITDVPAQFSLPTRLPPPMMPVVFNKLALPDTNSTPFPPIYSTEQTEAILDIVREMRIPPPTQPTLNLLEKPLRNPQAKYPTSKRGPNLDILRGMFPYEPDELTREDVENYTRRLVDRPLTIRGTQTEGYYPPSALEMTKGNVREYTTAKRVAGSSKLTQTAQTGESGMMATPAMRNKYPVGGYSRSERERLPSGARVMSPISGIRQFFPNPNPLNLQEGTDE